MHSFCYKLIFNTMLTEKEFRIFDGMEEANRAMTDKIEESAPTCHFRKMNQEEADSSDGHREVWWECSVCGHTKSL